MLGEVPKTAYLTWANVAIGLLFLLLDVALSFFLQLGLSTSLLTAAARCVIQLTIMGFVLKSVFETNHPWAVAGISCKSP
jgi:ABC-type iron transport system FetAB permease component